MCGQSENEVDTNRTQNVQKLETNRTRSGQKPETTWNEHEPELTIIIYNFLVFVSFQSREEVECP